MRFLMLVKSDANIESGALPDKKLFAEMAKYNRELAEAGALVSLDGLYPSMKGARVMFSSGKVTVTEGPFSNPTELVAGFWIIKMKSKEEAIEWAKRVPFENGVIEVREMQEMSDFPEDIQQAAKM